MLMMNGMVFLTFTFHISSLVTLSRYCLFHPSTNSRLSDVQSLSMNAQPRNYARRKKKKPPSMDIRTLSNTILPVSTVANTSAG